MAPRACLLDEPLMIDLTPFQRPQPWRYKGDGPVGYRVGRHVRCRREAVEAWLEQQADQR